MLDTIISFVKDYWLLILVAIVVLFIVSFLEKILVKLLFWGIIIGAILVFFFHYTPQQAIDLETSTVKKVYTSTIQPVVDSELKEAKYTMNPDGSYTIQTKSVKITGKKGDPTATVSFGGHDYKMNVSDLGSAIQSQINSMEQQPAQKK